MPLLTIPTGHVYDLTDLNNLIDEDLEKQTKDIACQLHEIVRYMIVVYEGFESQINNVSIR